MSGIFNAAIFNNGIFNVGGDAPAAAIVKTGTGGIDPGEGRRRQSIKPTGLLHLPEKRGRKNVEDRVSETLALDTEIAARLSREFIEDVIEAEAVPAITQMSLAQIEQEIRVLLHKKLRTESEEIMLLLLMIAVAV